MCHETGVTIPYRPVVIYCNTLSNGDIVFVFFDISVMWLLLPIALDYVMLRSKD